MLDLLKDQIKTGTGLSDPVLHVLVGIAVFVLAQVLLRVRLGSWLPWGAVLAVQLFNEAADMVGDHLRAGDVNVRGTIFDTLLTMAIPTILVLSFRLLRPSSAAR